MGQCREKIYEKPGYLDDGAKYLDDAAARLTCGLAIAGIAGLCVAGTDTKFFFQSRDLTPVFSYGLSIGSVLFPAWGLFQFLMVVSALRAALLSQFDWPHPLSKIVALAVSGVTALPIGVYVGSVVFQAGRGLLQ